MIIDHAEHAKPKNIGKERVEKKYRECAFKNGKNDRLTELCVFGYKVGRTIFTAFHPPKTKPPKFISVFVLTKKSLEKVNE